MAEVEQEHIGSVGMGAPAPQDRSNLLGDPTYCMLRRIPCSVPRLEALAGKVLGSRPSALILDVPPEFFKTERAVRTREEIDATLMIIVFNALQDGPAWINPHRHLRSSLPCFLRVYLGRVRISIGASIPARSNQEVPAEAMIDIAPASEKSAFRDAKEGDG